jgi:hypothetical protein
MPQICLIKHEVIPKCGSFEVRFPDGAPSRYFYWDDLPSRRLRPDLVDGETALEQAKAFARVQRERLGTSKGDPPLATGRSLVRKCSEVRPNRAVLLYRNSHRRKKAAIRERRRPRNIGLSDDRAPAGGLNARPGFDHVRDWNDLERSPGANADLRSEVPGLPAELRIGGLQDRVRLHIDGAMQCISVGPRGSMLHQSIFCAWISGAASPKLPPAISLTATHVSAKCRACVWPASMISGDTHRTRLSVQRMHSSLPRARPHLQTGDLFFLHAFFNISFHYRRRRKRRRARGRAA